MQSAYNLPLNTRVASQRKKRTADPDAYKIVSVRLREAEFLCLAEQAQACGLTNNKALRVAARRIAGFLEMDATTAEVLKQISQNIGVISDNIYDLRLIAQESQSLDLPRIEGMQVAFGKEFAQLDSLLRVLLNVSRRRVDGRAMLETAMSQ